MKSISILACGESGSEWDGLGPSLGVNDCWKFGKPTDWLLCVQTMQQMRREPPERLKTILDSKPLIFYTHKREWEGKFSQVNLIELHRWKGKLIKGKIQFSRTSPFIAIIMAYNIGFDTINLYGVDHNTHKYYSPGQSKDFIDEMKNYKELFKQLKAEGVTITATKQSYLNNFL